MYKRFRLKAIVSQWSRRCTTVGVFVGNREGAGSNLRMVFFFLFFFFLCLCMCGNDEGFVHFLYLVAKTPPAFPK